MIGHVRWVSSGCLVAVFFLAGSGSVVSQDLAYPEAYYGKGSTVDGDHMRGEAAMIHAMGAHRYATAMMYQQQLLLFQSQQQYHMQRLGMMNQMLAANGQPRIAELEKKVEILTEMNREVMKKLREMTSGPPSNHVDADASQATRLIGTERSRKVRSVR